MLTIFCNSVKSTSLTYDNYKNNNFYIDVFSANSDDDDEFFEQYDLLSNIDEFINLPDGATPWDIFGETVMHEYEFLDEDGFDWVGVRPEFKQKIKLLDNKDILMQGYMFPLDQNEKQKTFLLIPFPPSCPYYPHVSSNLIVEVHAENSISFSYEAINVEGTLELVPNDDLYNIFFRLRDATLVTN